MKQGDVELGARASCFITILMAAHLVLLPINSSYTICKFGFGQEMASGVSVQIAGFMRRKISSAWSSSTSLCPRFCSRFQFGQMDAFTSDSMSSGIARIVAAVPSLSKKSKMDRPKGA
ncbi:MAG: hypothetical protein H6577_26315 [Lewinellaceae bacterium]|nr:hypothetical protein [Lewinellaceae bacterium]